MKLQQNTRYQRHYEHLQDCETSPHSIRGGGYYGYGGGDQQINK